MTVSEKTRTEGANMTVSVKSNAKYALACVTSMGVRITPADRMAVHSSSEFLLQATSAETNVLNVAASLGRPCLALTKFVEGSPIAAFIKAQLKARNIAFEGPEVPQGGPGVCGISSTSPIPASACAPRACGTTGPVKSAAASAPGIMT